jgi:hypothetical protein
MKKLLDYSQSQSARYANYTSPTSVQPTYYQASPSCAGEEETVWTIIEPKIIPAIEPDPAEKDKGEG